MSATRYKKTHVDILICVEMARERNLGIKKTPGILKKTASRNQTSTSNE